MTDTLYQAAALLETAGEEHATVVRQRDKLQIELQQLDRRLQDAQRQITAYEKQAAEAELRAAEAEQRAKQSQDAVLSHTARTA